MTSKEIKRYEKKSIPELIKIATRHFNKYIRERDNESGCISCNTGQAQEAGHFYSGGHYSSLRFNENNVHGQCKKCNRHLHGNLLEYRRRITDRIDLSDLNELDRLADYYKRNGFKWDRFALIDIILKYK